MYKPLLVIVDQDPDARARTAELFAERYHCFVTGSAEEALASIRADHPVAVVVDFPIPLRSGGCLAAAINRDPETSHVPVVAYSSWNYPRTRATAREYGCAEFVARSAGPEALVAAVDRATGTREPMLHG